MRRRVRTVLIGVALAAAGWAYASTAAINWRSCQPARDSDSWARAWRVGGPTWRELEVFADVVRQMVPAGSVVAFRAVPAEHPVAWRIAYLLPELEVWPVSETTNLAGADYAAVLRGDWPRPDLDPLVAHRLGHLYRVAP